MSLLDTLTNCTNYYLDVSFLSIQNVIVVKKMRSIEPPLVFCMLNEKRTEQSRPEPIHYIHVEMKL